MNTTYIPNPPYTHEQHVFGFPMSPRCEEEGTATRRITDSDTSYAPFNKTAVSTKEAIKFDDGKLDWSLMPFDSVEEILKVLEFGKKKYAAHNWSQGEGFKYTRVFNSLMRHLFAWFRGQDNDPETGLSHIAHAGCNILFLLHFIKNKDKYKNNDDRPNLP